MHSDAIRCTDAQTRRHADTLDRWPEWHAVHLSSSRFMTQRDTREDTGRHTMRHTETHRDSTQEETPQRDVTAENASLAETTHTVLHTQH